MTTLDSGQHVPYSCTYTCPWATLIQPRPCIICLHAFKMTYLILRWFMHLEMVFNDKEKTSLSGMFRPVRKVVMVMHCTAAAVIFSVLANIHHHNQQLTRGRPEKHGASCCILVLVAPSASSFFILYAFWIIKRTLCQKLFFGELALLLLFFIPVYIKTTL